MPRWKAGSEEMCSKQGLYIFMGNVRYDLFRITLRHCALHTMTCLVTEWVRSRNTLCGTSYVSMRTIARRWTLAGPIMAPTAYSAM